MLDCCATEEFIPVNSSAMPVRRHSAPLRLTKLNCNIVYRFLELVKGSLVKGKMVNQIRVNGLNKNSLFNTYKLMDNNNFIQAQVGIYLVSGMER